jgi:catechol 2,3-dioxygenase-like lactoylglutathione lyase family enzyme
MLRKIDCLMIRVEDIEVSATYYAKVFGLRPKWSGEGARSRFSRYRCRNRASPRDNFSLIS